jgi:hypothetical protein
MVIGVILAELLQIRDLKRGPEGLRVRDIELDKWGVIVECGGMGTYYMRYDDDNHLYITMAGDVEVLLDTDGEPVYVPELMIDFP